MERLNLRTSLGTIGSRLAPFTGYIISGAIFMLLPLFLPPYTESILTKVFIFAIGALSLNLIFGRTGLISLGHAAYFGVATYAVGILTVHYGVKSFWLLLPAGILTATLLAAVFGVIALRVSGIYFMLVTLALGELVYSIVVKWTSVTGGTSALPGIMPPDLGLPWLTWNTTSFYYFVFLLFVICFFLLYRIVNSPFGHTLQGIRENKTRMLSLGYNTWLYQYIAFVIAGLFAGVAGILYGYYLGIAAPENVSITTSVALMFMVILGGSRVFVGPVAGAFIIVLLEYFISLYLPARWPLFLGCVFVIAIMFFRQGAIPYLIKLWGKVGYGHGIIKG